MYFSTHSSTKYADYIIIIEVNEYALCATMLDPKNTVDYVLKYILKQTLFVHNNRE